MATEEHWNCAGVHQVADFKRQMGSKHRAATDTTNGSRREVAALIGCCSLGSKYGFKDRGLNFIKSSPLPTVSSQGFDLIDFGLQESKFVTYCSSEEDVFH